jgi:hypothetical protein
MSFRDRPDMYLAPSAQPLLPHAFTDNTMPLRDWSAYDSPARYRFESQRQPVINWARGKRIDRTLKRIK